MFANFTELLKRPSNVKVPSEPLLNPLGVIKVGQILLRNNSIIRKPLNTFENGVLEDADGAAITG